MFDGSDSLKSISWIDFFRSALPASTIAEYGFCPAKIYNMMHQGDIESPITIAGSQIHEEEAQEILTQLGPLEQVEINTLFDAMLHSYSNLSLALEKREILANSEENILFRCIMPESGYVGKPDKADCRSGQQPIIIETKTTGNIPSSVWMDNRLQMGVYLIGLERLSFKPPYGIVEYVLRTDQSIRRSFTVQLDNSFRQTIQTTAKEVLAILKGKEPIPCNNPRKCIKCVYHDTCTWNLKEWNS